MNSVQLIETGDGSHSLLNVAMDETYHSRHGALRESEHVFIRHGLHAWLGQHATATKVRILEVGFGTGLNAILTVRESQQHPDVSFRYTTLEPHPLDKATVDGLNYLALLGDASLEPHFAALHQAPWEEDHTLLDNFMLRKTRSALQDFPLVPNTFDVVYFDAFAPNKQPELWTLSVLQRVATLMAPGAVFVTYSAKGQLKRDLKAINLLVETLEGPPGKAEMVRACKVNP
jgi:tRNA U34 5-methylaminomethyl-2-thiouridine-forming methyltransferase MnmC